MKYIKYAVSALLFFAIALCTGEFFQVHVGECYSLNYAELNLQDVAAADFYRDLDALARETDVCAYYRSIEGDNTGMYNDLTLYASDGRAMDFYNSRYKIYEGSYKSVFLSHSDVRQAPLTQCDASGRTIQINFIGEKENIETIVERLSKKYEVENAGLGSEESGFYNSEAFYIMTALWAVACAVIAVMSFYETALLKKEIAVKYSLGEKIGVVYFKKIAADFIVLTVLFAAVYAGLSLATYTAFALPVTLACFGAFLLTDVLCLLPILKIDLKKSLSGATASPSLLSATYTLKILTCVLTVVVASLVAAMASEALETKKQGDFFYKYKDFSYVNLHVWAPKGEARDPNAVLRYELQKELFADGGAVIQSEYGYSEEFADGREHTVIVCNRNARDNLPKSIKPEQLEDGKMYVLVPEYCGWENDVPIFKSYAEPRKSGSYIFCHDFETEVIPYECGESLTVLDDINSGAGKNVKDPIIIFSNLDESRLNVENPNGTLISRTETEDGGLAEEWEGGLFWEPSVQYLMLRTDEAYIKDFIARKGYEPSEVYYELTNVYEAFRQTHIRSQKLLTLSGIVLFFLLVLEWIMITVVIRLEYTVNAKEMAVKKVLGYGILEKNRKIFMITGGIITVGIFAALIICKVLEIGTPLFILAAGAFLALTELPIILYFIVRTEKAQIVKILKGGAL